MVVQACQHQIQSYDAWRTSTENTTNIILDRTHTVLLLSTMRHGYAKRGAYTGALSEQFKKANTKMDIHEMHNKAVAEMTKKFGDEQSPEIRSTLKKKLVLPGRAAAQVVGYYSLY